MDKYRFQMVDGRSAPHRIVPAASDDEARELIRNILHETGGELIGEITIQGDELQTPLRTLPLDTLIGFGV